MSTSAKKVVIYTDGACKGNPGAGGWGAVLQWGDATRELCGGEAHTTNNRMELTAAIRALSALTRDCDVVLHTDSIYLKQGITAWLPQWQKNAGGNGLVRLQSGKKRSVKNADLWMELLAAAKPHRVDWRWVEAHIGQVGNERADALANHGVRQFLPSAPSTDVNLNQQPNTLTQSHGQDKPPFSAEYPSAK